MVALQMILWLVMVGLLALLGWTKGITRKVTKTEGRRDELEVGINFGVIGLVLVLFFIGNVCIWRSFGQVPAGSRGVVLQFGAVTGETKMPGLYVVTPFINSVELMEVRVRKHTTKAGAASKDLQDVTTVAALNYYADPKRCPNIFDTLKRTGEEVIIDPSVQEAVKSVTARYDAVQLVTERSAVRGAIEDVLRSRLMRHGFVLDQLSITDFDFDPEFAAAIERKMVAAQNVLTAENELRTVKVTAEKAVAEAKGKAEAIRITVESINAQGGQSYIQLQAIEAWKSGGANVPTYMGGNTPIPFLQVK